MPDSLTITPADPPSAHDVVQVLMTEEMARLFEERCLGTNTRGMTSLSPPIRFTEDDLPTYIIQVDSPQT